MIKDFEKSLRVELASGRNPSEVLLIEWGRKQEEGSLSLRCMTLVLTHLEVSEGWDVLKEAALEALDETPSDATAVLSQACRLAGWDQITLKEFNEEGSCGVQATLKLRGHLFRGTVHGPVTPDSKHRAAYQLLHGITKRSTQREASSFSRLHQICKARGLKPRFRFQAKNGTIQCQAECSGIVVTQAARNRHQAHLVACEALLNQLQA